MPLKVAGIISSLEPSSAFWQHDPELAVPELEGPFGVTALAWRRVRRGPGDLAGLTAAYNGQNERATWFFPMSTRLTATDVARIVSGVAALASGPGDAQRRGRVRGSGLADTATSTGLADGPPPSTASGTPPSA